MVSANTVTIMQFKYTLDWFDIKPVDVDLAIKPRLTFEYRLGEWFLEGKYWDKAKQEWVRHIESINLSNARDAYHALKNHVTEIRCLHQQGEHFTKAVADLVLNKQAGEGECMTIQRYELLDLTSDDGPRAMVTEYEEGAYVLHTDHVVEVAALKARIAELEKKKGQQVVESEEGFITNVELDSGAPDCYWDGKGDLHRNYADKTITLTMADGTKKVFRFAE